jgi:hypothetical protein
VKRGEEFAPFDPVILHVQRQFFERIPLRQERPTAWDRGRDEGYDLAPAFRFVAARPAPPRLRTPHPSFPIANMPDETAIRPDMHFILSEGAFHPCVCMVHPHRMKLYLGGIEIGFG